MRSGAALGTLLSLSLSLGDLAAQDGGRFLAPFNHQNWKDGQWLVFGSDATWPGGLTDALSWQH
jgi:hypothetical protein